MRCCEIVAPDSGVTVALSCATSRCAARRSVFVLLALVCVGWVIASSPAVAGEGKPIKERIVGAWSFVTSINTRMDGSTFDRWGPNPVGMLIFDGQGHYSQMITSNDRIFGVKTVASFGQYTVDEAGKVISIKIEGSTTSRVVGSTQRREIVALTADELRYVNPLTPSGNKAEMVWKRVK